VFLAVLASLVPEAVIVIWNDPIILTNRAT